MRKLIVLGMLISSIVLGVTMYYAGVKCAGFSGFVRHVKNANTVSIVLKMVVFVVFAISGLSLGMDSNRKKK